MGGGGAAQFAQTEGIAEITRRLKPKQKDKLKRPHTGERTGVTLRQYSEVTARGSRLMSTNTKNRRLPEKRLSEKRVHERVMGGTKWPLGDRLFDERPAKGDLKE